MHVVYMLSQGYTNSATTQTDHRLDRQSWHLNLLDTSILQLLLQNRKSKDRDVRGFNVDKLEVGPKSPLA